jgi:hypothetical protein
MCEQTAHDQPARVIVQMQVQLAFFAALDMGDGRHLHHQAAVDLPEALRRQPVQQLSALCGFQYSAAASAGATRQPAARRPGG